jgi:rhodanese-related sulfurtransferase
MAQSLLLNMNIQNISVNELDKLKKSENVYILDVRTYEEFAFANIGGVHIPLDELADRFNEVPKNQKIFCLCHHGVRSLYACQILSQLGFKDVWNIEGGIENWSLMVDPQIARY